MSIRMLEEECRFHSARPVWLRDAENEVNITCGFYASVTGNRTAILRIAADSMYKLYINGEFVCFGPVRTAHGYHRMDAIDVTALLTPEENHIAIEVWNPNRYCFSLVKAPAFLQAEVERSGTVIAATAAENSAFTGFRLNQRIRNVQNYSFQRAQAESYRLSPQDNLWRLGDFRFVTREPLENTCRKELLPRGLPAHQYSFAPARNITALGTGQFHAKPVTNSIRHDYPKELDIYLTDEAQTFRYLQTGTGGSLPRRISGGEYLILNTAGEKSGFITLKLSCAQPTVLWLEWDELLTDSLVAYDRLSTASVMRLELEPGTYEFESFDVYALKYLQITCSGGAADLQDAGIREYRYPLPTQEASGSDDSVLEKLWQAARETFCQNASDIFMDCPHRERAGWLCDSFFIARTEYALTGACRVERQFLENFLLPDRFDFLPEGMLPMCYPSDHADGNYIPNWAMWYVTELSDHVRRTGDRSLADSAEKRVYKLLDFLRQYENEYGLLEKLDRWVFVEWSAANSFVQDVNFPTNMHYASLLKTAGELYGDAGLVLRSDKLRSTIREMAFDGEFFIDNAVRGEDGRLHQTRNRTETCQYYAFFFETATPELYGELWTKLVTDFGPHRTEKGLWPQIHPSNAFIGNYLRLDLLVTHGLHRQCLEESKEYFGYMADTTGTLWENNHARASCNHGFASYFIYLLQQILK